MTLLCSYVCTYMCTCIGISYIPAMIEEDRSATMSRIETRKNKKGSLNVLPASSEEMLEGAYIYLYV